MILVTVGSTSFPFPRMANLVKTLAYADTSQEKIIFQYGHTPPTNVNHNIELEPFVSHEKLIAYMRRARVIICHGGPATIFQALSLGKIPWVLPREKRFGEQVNNYQVDFGRFMARQGLARIIEPDTNPKAMCGKPRTVSPLRRQNTELISYLNSITE